MTTRRCPVCARHVARLVSQFRGREVRSAADKLREAHTSWNLSSGCCERCLTTAAGKADAWYFRGPVRSQFALLPLPLRTDADQRFTGRGVTIAFIDSGFFPHPDLVRGSNRILASIDVTDDAFSDRYFRRPHPESWHGTMSAVLACGSGSLSGGVYRGIASEAHLVCVKVLNTRTGHISEKDIARGIQWVIDNQVRYNIRILNIAVGADKPQSLAESAIDKLVEQAVAAGVMVVVAGGNSPGSAILPPASAPSALTVGGYDDHSNLATGDWSMYHSTSGETLDGISKPDILGPATELPGPLLPGTDQAADAKALFSLLDSEDHSVHGVYELVRQDLMEKPKKGARLHSWARKRLAAAKYVTRNHKKMEGTSVAAGIVTSVAAQVLEVHPGLLPSAVRSILLTSAVPMKGVPDEIQGAGRLNARAAVRLALARRETGEEKDVLLVPRYVSLQYRDKAAQQVSITGEFNNWNPDAHPCHEVEEGVWSCLFPEPEPGKERYKLVVDGTRWVEDPAAPSREPDGFGGWNSRFHPGKKAE